MPGYGTSMLLHDHQELAGSAMGQLGAPLPRDPQSRDAAAAMKQRSLQVLHQGQASPVVSAQCIVRGASSRTGQRCATDTSLKGACHLSNLCTVAPCRL